MIYFEITLYYSSDLNQFSDLSFGQQGELLLLDMYSEAGYATSEETERWKCKERSEIMFDPYNGYFMVTKNLGSRSFVVPVWT